MAAGFTAETDVSSLRRFFVIWIFAISHVIKPHVRSMGCAEIPFRNGSNHFILEIHFTILLCPSIYSPPTKIHMWTARIYHHFCHVICFFFRFLFLLLGRCDAFSFSDYSAYTSELATLWNQLKRESYEDQVGWWVQTKNEKTQRIQHNFVIFFCKIRSRLFSEGNFFFLIILWFLICDSHSRSTFEYVSKYILENKEF